MRHLLLAILLAGCTDGLEPIDDSGDPDTAVESALIGILVTPENLTIPLGEEVQLTATGLREDRSTVDLTAVVEWSSNNTNIAAPSNDLDAEGLIEGLAVDSATIVAGTGSILSPPVSVKVSQAELLGLNVEPSTVSLEAGDTVQLRATAAFSDGTRSDASSQVRWITGSGSVATTQANGLLTAVASGQTEIVAEWNQMQAEPVPVTVVQTAQADVSIADVQFDASGSEVTVTIQVQNNGNVGASDYYVDVFIDPETPPSVGDLGDQYFPMFYTEAGDTSEVVWTFDAEAGEHELVVVIDTDGLVDETNESNNVSTHPFTVTGEVGGPNLELSYFDFIADSESIYYVIDVTNTGGEDVGEFYIDMWVDSFDDPTPSGIGDMFLRIPSLAAGETTVADFYFEDTTCIFCWSWAMADTNLEVEETDETDNVVGPLEVDSPTE